MTLLSEHNAADEPDELEGTTCPFTNNGTCEKNYCQLWITLEKRGEYQFGCCCIAAFAKWAIMTGNHLYPF